MINSIETLNPVLPKIHQPWWKRSFVQRLFLLLATAMVAASLGLSLFISPPVHAATRSFATCAQNPVFQNCQHEDPVGEDCTPDAQTKLVVPILRQGVTVGLLERRTSFRCNSSWGRCTSLSQGFANLFLLSPYRQDINGTFRGRAQNPYTDMVFGSTPLSLRCVIGFSATDAPTASIG